MSCIRRFYLENNIKFRTFSQCRRISQKKNRYDMIGPPDKISNLHTIKYAIRENETPLEQKLRTHREDLQAWNQEFWTIHNSSFIERKKEFEKIENEKNGSTNQPLSADEISVFYKKFLDDNWRTHVKYLLEWYCKNVFVTFLHVRVLIDNIIKRKF